MSHALMCRIISLMVILITTVHGDEPRYRKETNEIIRKLQEEQLTSVGIYYYSPYSKNESRIHPEDPPPIGFNASLPIKVIIHGWMGNKNHITIDPVKNAYLALSCCNIITVNWEGGARQNYDVARYMVDTVGKRAGELLHSFLMKMNASAVDVHILGHSLGAHIAGNIGKYFNGTIGRISALDPAGPLFRVNSTDACGRKDAIFVDAIHTDVGVLGEKTQRGHVDFYPNRGFPPQPGCYLLDILTFSSCSHFRAPLLYAESILLPEQFLAVQCEISELFNSIKKCRPKNNLISREKRQMIFMGEATPSRFIKRILKKKNNKFCDNFFTMQRDVVVLCFVFSFYGLSVLGEDLNLDSVKMYYFAPELSTEMLLDNGSTPLPYFNESETVKVIIHGYIAGYKHLSISPLRNAYLSAGAHNVFCVDWSELAFGFYPTVRYRVAKVGHHLGYMMRTQIMSRYPNIPLEQIHVLGHSLGAHIAGNVGRSFNGRIGRVTGLDPAHPAFNEGDKDWVSPSTALFVDTIHTAGNTLGQMTPTGHVSFYPNGGPPPQPGCLLIDYATFVQCSHLRAPIFYAESIIHPKAFPGVKCDFDTITNDVEQCPSLRDSTDIAYMGEFVDRKATGTYFFLTYSVPPFGKGARF
ncbi:uncharacterized protein LOC129794335 [Lutzomyia longipalpis]|uniref:uncharacterized protein LOC129794335 n=1 Tax=Lutzomyia longipalpis TaxID=7200 RepID=UPI0024833009|nr:uncharacterized protein LOC129794335 [Lutzomyia longipalpis]